MADYSHFSCKIANVIEETHVVRSFLLETPRELTVNPGQFMMVWIPGQSEKNIPVSYDDPYERMIGITLKKRTPKPAICEICNSCGVCEVVFDMKKGDVVRVRGPYGRGFTLQGEDLLLIGYETRAAPLVLLADKASSMNRKVTAVIVAPTEDRLPFIQRLKALKVDVMTVTEQGSTKRASSIEEDVKSIIEEKATFDSAYLSAPEKVSKALLGVTRGYNIPTQALIERHIHCGIGICGECSIDPTGKRVCVEGPVFWDRELEHSEYGEYRRLSLRKIGIGKGPSEK